MLAVALSRVWQGCCRTLLRHWQMPLDALNARDTISELRDEVTAGATEAHFSREWLTLA